MGGVISPPIVFQGLSPGGQPLAGGRLSTFIAGTSTPQATFTDASLTVPNSNPVVLNASGQASVWLDPTLAYKYILKDAFGDVIDQADNVQGTLTEASLTQQFLGKIIYPETAQEIAAGVTPTNFIYPYGCPRRFGAVGNGFHDDTAAVQAAINSSFMYWGWYGDSYGVTTVFWPSTLSEAHFNGTDLVGLATTATTCVSQIKCSFVSFYGYTVNQGNATGVIPNPNYTCATWWFNGTGTTPTGASQFNNFFGFLTINATRALVYGQLPGNPDTTIVHSENAIYGFYSDGVSNPFFVNSSTGFVHVYGSTFFRDASTWTNPTLPTTARAFEVVSGSLFINGGEIIASNSLVGFATEGQATVNGAFWEISAPIHVTGDSMRIVNCQIQVNNQGVEMFTIASGSTGAMKIDGCVLQRPSGIGSTDRSTMIDGTLAPAFEVILTDSISREYSFAMQGANVKLISGCIATYANHSYQQFSGQPIYKINTRPRNSIIPDLTLDHLGYTTTGWILNIIFGGGTTFANTTNVGPTGYLASQLTLTATGQSQAQSGDSTSLTTIKATMQRVFPGEQFWLSAWMNQATGGGSAQLIAQLYTLAGASLAAIAVADNTSIGTNQWVFVEGGFVVPATAAYMAIGVLGITNVLQFTDIRVIRAS
jgi:hypothetical protein